jgi:aspartyl-tRNA(Asn)/glutamyl-tRNA(Gln) amidotransferase subunit A
MARDARTSVLRAASTTALHGMPVAVKDPDVAGVRTTGGSERSRDHVAGRDSGVVERLRRGRGHRRKDEPTNGRSASRARTPTSEQRRTPGPVATSAVERRHHHRGRHGHASSRRGATPAIDPIPAALCGIAGLKPTYGRVSLRGAIACRGRWTTPARSPARCDPRGVSPRLRLRRRGPGERGRPGRGLGAVSKTVSAECVLVLRNHFFEELTRTSSARPRRDQVSGRPAPWSTSAHPHTESSATCVYADHRGRCGRLPPRRLERRAADIGADARAAHRGHASAPQHAQARRGSRHHPPRPGEDPREYDVIACPTTATAARHGGRGLRW